MQNFYIKDVLKAVNGSLLCGDLQTRIDTVSTDSKNIGTNCLFVPIIGERVDAHRFIGDAAANGAAASFTSEHDEADKSIAYIRVSDTQEALKDLGRYYGNLITIPKIGITGSVGKTTTKEMIACALSAGKKVFKTSGNNNSQIGVPLTLLRMSGEDEIAVIEMGISIPGEMNKLASLLTLDCAVVTNIGVSHIEQLKTQDGICEEKFHIEEAIKGDGPLFLNGDDEVIKRHMGELKHSFILFGLDENNDYRAVNIKSNSSGTGTDFDILNNNKKYHVRLNVLGTHNVRNALVAFAIATRYGIQAEAAIEALAGFEGVSMRQQISVVNGITYIDDSYNASPDSMRAGINVLCQLESKGRRIAVLADMLELGDKSPEYHYETGRYISTQPVDEVIIYGSLAGEIGKGATLNGDIKVTEMDSREKINEYLQNTLKAGDTVLFKGSRGMKLNECADFFVKKEN